MYILCVFNFFLFFLSIYCLFVCLEHDFYNNNNMSAAAEECQNASTPLKSGIRIYRRLAANSASSSPLIYSRDQHKHSVRQRTAVMGTDDDRGDSVTAACSDARLGNDGRVSRPAHDDRQPVSIEHVATVSVS